MGIEIAKTRIRIRHPSLSPKIGHDMVNRPGRHRAIAITEKDRPGFSTANEDEQVTEIVIVDDRNDACFAAFAFVNGYAFALHIEVTYIEMDQFITTNPEPPKRFDQASIPKLVGSK